MNLYRVTWRTTAYIDAESESEAIKLAGDGRTEDEEVDEIEAEFIAP